MLEPGVQSVGPHPLILFAVGLVLGFDIDQHLIDPLYLCRMSLSPLCPPSV